MNTLREEADFSCSFLDVYFKIPTVGASSSRSVSLVCVTDCSIKAPAFIVLMMLSMRECVGSETAEASQMTSSGCVKVSLSFSFFKLLSLSESLYMYVEVIPHYTLTWRSSSFDYTECPPPHPNCKLLL